MTSQAIAELESHDIAPDEDLRPVMDLFPASERPGGMSSLWLRRLALESAAQGHFWDKSQMTPVETSAVLDALDETSNTAAFTSEQCARLEARLLVRRHVGLGLPDGGSEDDAPHDLIADGRGDLSRRGARDPRGSRRRRRPGVHRPGSSSRQPSLRVDATGSLFAEGKRRSQTHHAT